MKFTARGIHRDFGYFYIGLIISFAASGLMMNHREHWHPEKYIVEVTEFQKQPFQSSAISDSSIRNFVAKELQVKDKVKRHNLRKDKLKITCDNHDIEMDIKTGKGEIANFKKTPLIAQMMQLHKTNNSNWWIYYSDVFALSLIVIAVTGTFIMGKSKYSFKQRGWKLAIAGLLFPILFLIFLG